ncbi:hypothetical protein [Deinococcus alpinitundrae]|uniref:hypothetical protein n=1 Tax=Deinococcus alpinitundrae TaxID=468913 RepID=UPI00137A14AA|nr:hypothetical protein [Deinococcus alpinitundrae]
MNASTMDWRGLLATLRAHLPAQREAGSVRGSLRWLEEAMRARGAGAAAVRNIVYRDVGTPADKQALHAILGGLCAEVGLNVPPLHLPPGSPADLELLGRRKKRAFRTFMAALRAGRTPRLIVAGQPGVGKTLLIEHLEREIAAQHPPLRVTRLLLGADLGTALTQLPVPGQSGPVELHPGLPFAVQAEQQQQLARQFLRGCLPITPQGEGAEGVGGVLLIRVQQGGQFSGAPPRGDEAAPISAAAWAAEYLLRRAPAGLAVLLALEDDRTLAPADRAGVIRLLPPTPGEARAYLMSRLTVDAAQADALVRRTGRHLDRLTLLASARSGQGFDVPRLLADPEAARLLAALQVALGDDSSAPRSVLEAALGQALDSLPTHLRALIDEINPAEPRPVSLALVREAAALQEADLLRRTRRRLVAALGSAPQWATWSLRVLADLGEWRALADWFGAHPGSAVLAGGLWSAARRFAPPTERAALARWVVVSHATLGRYDHPQARDALFALLAAGELGARVWARVKLAESSVDAGNFEAAAAQLAQPDVQAALSTAGPSGSWFSEAQADALLVEAALRRWQGDLGAATVLVEDPRTAPGGARATLWRGLIAKDAGRWDEALKHLTSVPPTAALLHARARAQEGDLRLRLGQTGAALAALDDACTRLRLGGAAAQERARVEARAATALRRLGQLNAALARSQLAQSMAADADLVLRSRLESESIPLLLALGRWPEARSAAAQALAWLARPGPRRAEAAYRARRTHYRAALISLSRGLGLPYLHPLGGPESDNADLRQARQLLDKLLDAPPRQADREQVLVFDMRLSRALCEPEAGAALWHADLALALTDHPYAEAQARAIRAEALLRGHQPGAALGEINRAHALLRRVSPLGLTDADPGLQALLLTLEVRASLPGDVPGRLSGSADATLGWLERALGEPHLAPFRAGVWREVGRLLEQLGGGEALALVRWPTLDLALWRLADALPLLQTGPGTGVTAESAAPRQPR